MPQGSFNRLRAQQALADWLAAPTPRFAVEIAADRVAGARAGPRGAVLRTAARPLPPGLVEPAATRPNLSDSAAVARELRALLANLGAEADAEATLLVPDLTARVFVLDFDSLPGRSEELAALVRFRLRKSLPFDVERAVIGCQVMSAARAGAGRLLAAVADRTRLDEYEQCLESAGARAGVVIPSGLACLAAHPALAHATLLVRAEPGSLTTAYCRRGQVEFYRVTEIEAEPAFEDIVPSAAFYRDHWAAAAGAEESAAPALFTAGLRAGTLSRLRSQLPWAEFREFDATPAGASGNGAQLLAVSGALQGKFA